MREWIVQPDPQRVAEVATEVRALLMTGARHGRKVRLTAQEYKPRRSDRQNKFYWPAMVKALAQFMAEQDGLDTCTPQYMDDAHDDLKDQFLRVPQVSPVTGEVRFDRRGNPKMRTRSTTELTTAEFNQYLDQCARYIHELTGEPLPEPREYHERDEQPTRRNRGQTCQN